MNVRKIISVAVVLSITGAATLLLAADQPPIEPSPGEEPREQLSGLTAKERNARIKEMRERGEGPFRDDAQRRSKGLRNLPLEDRQSKIKELTGKMGVTNRAGFEKLREELRDLPPQERVAKLRTLREKSVRSMLPDEVRDVRRKEIRQRLDTQIDQLRKKQASGSITDVESRRLQRLEQIAAQPPQAEETFTPKANGAEPGHSPGDFRPAPPERPPREAREPRVRRRLDTTTQPENLPSSEPK